LTRKILNSSFDNRANGGFAVIEFQNIESVDLALKRFLSKNGIYNKKYKGD